MKKHKKIKKLLDLIPGDLVFCFNDQIAIIVLSVSYDENYELQLTLYECENPSKIRNYIRLVSKERSLQSFFGNHMIYRS